MHRFTIKRKICDTLLGATYECERQCAVPNKRRASSVVIKFSSQPAEVAQAAAHDAALCALAHQVDDPSRERRVVDKLIVSGGHDNVLQFYDHFLTDENTVCIVSEFCADGDLFQYLSASPTGSIPQAEAIAIVTQVARGLRFLHAVGYAHRDVSLENVLSRGGVWKLCDFGAAVAVGTRCVDRVGKSQYMAPEVVSASASEDAWYDASLADVWSLGVVLFILLTGSPLVCVASVEDPRYVVLTHRGVGAILRSWGVQVTEEVESLLSSMLEADPSRRIGMADALASLASLAVPVA